MDFAYDISQWSLKEHTYTIRNVTKTYIASFSHLPKALFD